MATPTSLNTGQNNPQSNSGNTTNPPQSSLLGKAWKWGKSFVYSPIRHGSEEALQGLANRFTELFNVNQPEITQRVRDIFIDAFLRHTPDYYHQLLYHIQSFLRKPSKIDLDQVNQLLSQFDEAEVRSLVPFIHPDEMDALKTLKDILSKEVSENSPNGSSEPPTLKVNSAASRKLKYVGDILEAIIKNHEGVLIQTMNTLTDTMRSTDGPMRALRDQLNSRASSELREAKYVFDAYRTAIQRSANPAELTLLQQSLKTKIALLLASRTIAPQIISGQWEQIEQFDHLLQTHITSPATPPAHSQLLAETNTAHQILSAAFNNQRGMVEEAADIFVDALGRGVEHLVPLPARMLQGVLSPQTPAGTAQPPTPPSPPPQAPAAPSSTTSAVLNFGSLINQGQTFLSSLLTNAGGVFSQQAASSLATLVTYAFEKIQDHVQQNGAHPHLLGTITPMIQRLKEATTQSSWNQLIDVLKDAFRFMQEQQVYLQGLRLPLNPIRNHNSPIPQFLNNINTHQNLLEPIANRNQQKITLKMIDEQACLLKVRSASYGIARMIAEKICGLDGSASFYAAIYGPALDPSETDLAPVFRQRLFDKIDSADINFFTKWFGKRVYDLLHPLSNFYTNSLVGSILEQAMSWMKADPAAPESKDEFLIKILRNWMAVTSGAFNQLANTPAAQSKDFNAMMEEALKNPERNGGLTQQELYAAVGKTAIDTFGPRIKWDESIETYFKTEISSDSPLYFLNPIAKGISIFSSYCLKAIVFVPQWLGNQTLQAGAKLALNHMPLLNNYAEKTIESLRRNTPSSYAMHRLIFRQQQKILALLQQRLNNDDGEGIETLGRNSNIKKVELTALVEYSLEILNKGQYRTQDRLHNYLNNRASLRDRVGHELENSFLPDVMDTAVRTISIALSAMTSEQEMQQMLFDSLQIANDTFNDKKPISDDEFAAVEKGIREMTDQILEAAIFHAIGEKFDYTNEKQKRGISQFTDSLKEQTRVYSSQLRSAAEQMTASSSLHSCDLQNTVSNLIQASAKYNKERVDALSKADGNRNFHTETKYHFNELSRQLLGQCTPLSNRLNTIKNQTDELVHLDKLLIPLTLCQQIQYSLQQKWQNPRLCAEDLSFSKLQILLLEQHLTTLRQSKCPVPLLEEIKSYIQGFSNAITAIESHQKTETILHDAWLLFSKIEQEKLNRINASPSPQLKNFEKQLCDLLATLPATDQKTRLTEHLLSFMLSNQLHIAHTAATRFTSCIEEILARNSSEANRHHELLKSSRASFQNRLAQSIQEYTHLYNQSSNSIGVHARELLTEVNKLDQWVQNQHELPIWNLFAFDMQWVTEMVKNLAFDQAKAKIQLLFDAIYQRYNYIGIVNQVALLPFLEHCGKHHLKKP